MALPGESITDLIALTGKERDEYFNTYARYFRDAPGGRGSKYAIRLGSKSLFSDDTYDLKLQFLRALKYLKASETRRKNRKPAKTGKR